MHVSSILCIYASTRSRSTYTSGHSHMHTEQYDCSNKFAAVYMKNTHAFVSNNKQNLCHVCCNSMTSKLKNKTNEKKKYISVLYYDKGNYYNKFVNYHLSKHVVFATAYYVSNAIDTCCIKGKNFVEICTIL